MIRSARTLRPIPEVTSCLKFMVLHVDCRDYKNGDMNISEGENENSRFEDSSEYVESDHEDDENMIARVVLFGSTERGNSISIALRNYRPWIRVQVKDNISDSEVSVLKAYFQKNLSKSNSTKQRVDIKIEQRKKFYGWQPDPLDDSKTRKFTFATVFFDSFVETTRAASRCSSGSSVPFVLDLVDTQIKNNSKFCNDARIIMSDWAILTLDSSCIVSTSPSNFASRFSNCQIEIEADVSLLSPCESPDTKIAPLLIASIDGEMYSDDGSFPDYLKGDNTIFIGISTWVTGTPLVYPSLRRFMFCVTSELPITEDDEMECFYFADSRTLFEGFRDFIIAADPDILTGWNTFGFDYPFMYGEYTQSFLPQGERGTEHLQQLLITLLPNSPSSVPSESAAQLLNKARQVNSATAKSWTSKMMYTVGISATKTLLKEEKLMSNFKSSRNLSSFNGGNTFFSSISSSYSPKDDSDYLEGEDEHSKDANEDDTIQEDEVSSLSSLSSGLAEVYAKKFRIQLLEDFPLRRTSTTFMDAFTILKMRANPSEVEEFKSNLVKKLPMPTSSLLLRKRPAKIVHRGMYFSRFSRERSKLIEKRMSSAARGDNVYSYINMTGRVNIDLMQIIKDDKKPESNTLKFAASTFLAANQEKIDLSASEMFAHYRSGDPQKLKDIAKYCARDCDIPLLLISKLSYMPTWIEMSRVCYTSFHDVVNSGQQVKIMNLIARFVSDEYAINLRDSGWPDNELDEEDEGKRAAPDYEGATVIEPVTGFYEHCVSTLDFESLYPSIMRYFNLCPSTLVLDDDVLQMKYAQYTTSKSNGSNDAKSPSSTCASSPSSFPFPLASTSSARSPIPKRGNVRFESHVIRNNVLVSKRPLKYELQDRTYTFAMHVTGVLPSLLKRLIEARKAVKKLMNESKDPNEKAILNGRQNGLKVACNSCYGFCGVSKKRGLMPCKPVAAVTTLKGRLFIDFSKNFTERNFPGSRVIYGDTDSVMVFWGPGISVERANELGEDAANKITAEIRGGRVTEIGGAGSLSYSLSQAPRDESVWSGRTDLAEACSAVRLTNEKVYFPYLLLKKKNYAAIKFTSDGKGGFKEELDMKGIDAVRRDRSQLVRDSSNAVLHSLLYDRSVAVAIQSLKKQLRDMAENKIPVSAYVLSKSLKSNYSSSNLPHVMAWKRMIERGDEGAPPVGARMPYVVLVDSAGLGGKETSVKLYERSEHPEYIVSGKTKRKLDIPYYIESLFNPLAKLLQFCKIEDLRFVFDEAITLSANKLKNIRSLSEYTGSSSTNTLNSSTLNSNTLNTSSNFLSQDKKDKKRTSDKNVQINEVKSEHKKKRSKVISVKQSQEDSTEKKECSSSLPAQASLRSFFQVHLQ